MVVGELTQETEVLVIGAGPSGYAAAFRAADLGLEVTMVDAEPRPGGECLFRGCIPSKTLLYLAEIIHDAHRTQSMGITFGEPRIDLEKLRLWKGKVIDILANGLVTLSNRRSVELIKGRARFEGSNVVRVYDSEISHIKFRHAILATGSQTTPFPGVTFSPGSRVMDSAGALELTDIPRSLLVVGGGFIALELGTVYASLGSKVTIAERTERLLQGADMDLVEPLARRLKEIFAGFYFNTEISALKEGVKSVEVTFTGEVDKPQQTFERVLIAIGRQPNSHNLGLETTKATVDEHGFVVVDEQQRTSDPQIFAVGDVARNPLLAHKAFREGKVAAEVIAGEPSSFDVRAIPAVLYTDPQVAWCGLTEEQARKQNLPIKVERFPWKFSSRATTMDAPEGMTKIIADPTTKRILGLGMVGRGAEGLIGEGVLAVEMGALAEDVALSIHPHPTLSETVGETAQIFLGSVTHLLLKQKQQ